MRDPVSENVVAPLPEELSGGLVIVAACVSP
jgi:hypothetical protein